MPSDIASHVVHTHPMLNKTAINNGPSPLDLNNLDALNNLGGDDVYLTANDDWTAAPDWVRGVKPDASGKTNSVTSAAVVVNDKGDGTVDAFYFYFCR